MAQATVASLTPAVALTIKVQAENTGGGGTGTVNASHSTLAIMPWPG